MNRRTIGTVLVILVALAAIGFGAYHGMLAMYGAPVRSAVADGAAVVTIRHTRSWSSGTISVVIRDHTGRGILWRAYTDAGPEEAWSFRMRPGANPVDLDATVPVDATSVEFDDHVMFDGGHRYEVALHSERDDGSRSIFVTNVTVPTPR